MNQTPAARGRSTPKYQLTLASTGKVGHEGPPSENSPLIDFALKGLERCWLPELGRWSHIYHLDGRRRANESLPHSDVFYTLNVLLGLARVPRIPDAIRVRDIFQRNVPLLLTLPVRKYAFGVALWSAAELDLAVPKDIADDLWAFLSDASNWRNLRAQDVGMILTGVVAQARRLPERWSGIADALFSHIVAEFHRPSGLFGDAPSGLRRRFATFASQVYLAIGCYSYGRQKGEIRAIEIANRCSQNLIAMQGPNGEWPWFFDAAGGAVVDFYEVYSVHQYGMAPALLEFAESHDVSEARSALVKGFNWVLGGNQLARPMFDNGTRLSIRSQARKGELNTDKWRALRAVRNTILGPTSGLAEPKNLELRLECRSYELGWILWAFGQRTDLPELTHHRFFTDIRSAPTH
jgi:hypothetical protein